MVPQDSKAVFCSAEKFPSATAFGRVGMLMLLCAALFAGCAGGDPRLTEALENIQHPDEAFRLDGLSTLSGMGEKAKSHADKIAALLKDTSVEVREQSMMLLVEWKYSSPEMVQELIAMVAGDEDEGVRVSALGALSTLGVQEEFLKASKAILAGDNAYLKGETIYTIGQSGKESVTAMKSELEAIAGGSDADLATEAKAALQGLED